MSSIRNFALILIIMSSVLNQEFPSVSIYTQQKIEFSLITGQINDIITSFFNKTKINDSWYFSETSHFEKFYLNLSNFKISFTFDTNKVIPSEVSDGFYLNCNDSLLITLSCDFDSRTGEATYPKGNAVFKFTTYGMFFIKRIYKNGSQIVENATITSAYNMTYSTDYTKEDNVLKGYFENIIKTNVSAWQSGLTNNLNIEANNWLANNPKPVTWQVSTSNPDANYTIDMSYWSNPNYTIIKDGIIFYHNGIVSLNPAQVNKKPTKGFLKKEVVKTTSSYSKWDDFVEEDGNHQMFFSANFFGSIINKIATSHSLNYSFTQDQLPPNAPYKLDIRSLNIIYPGISASYAPDTPIFVEIALQEGTFTQNGHIPAGRYNFLFTVKLATDLTAIMQWRSTLDFTTHYDYELQRLNLFIDSDISVADTTIISAPVGTVDIVTLEKWIEASFLLFPDFPLLKNGIDLSKEFISSSSTVIAQQGVLVYGQYLVIGDKKMRSVKPQLEYLI